MVYTFFLGRSNRTTFAILFNIEIFLELFLADACDPPEGVHDAVNHRRLLHSYSKVHRHRHAHMHV